MAITSYTDLQASMKRWLKRADLSDLFPDFIMLAEAHFDRTIYTRNARATFQITPTAPRIGLPSDWRRIIRAYYGGNTLSPFPSDFDSAYANGQQRDIGFGYQIQGNSMTLSVPQLGQVLRLDYYTLIEPLSDSNESNWLLEDAPDAYLYGALHEAAVYTRDDARATLWGQKRDAAIGELIDDDNAAKVPEQPLTMRRA
ncbi:MULTISPECIES: hypothetical protein [Pandoraea]|uniref:phage adaptor protein n=1 Tax=Pandoraea TaxID=93217 RepID=UPI001F5D1134|nr:MULTISPECIES: hypothetical protein [Pandoraea]MCI3206558.1 hypothetical protein [Pandoraea sp. LA3]MDN4584586.1 hypothetical protein [Pandoraea capi]